MSTHVAVRFATETDTTAIISFLKGLAAYEAASDGGYEGEVTVTEERLSALLFDERAIEAIVAEDASGLVGCAVFYETVSTWSGARCLYLEDLFVDQSARGAGAGRALMANLAELCAERAYVRIDWICSAANASGQAFYDRLGAVRMDEAIHHRLAGEALAALGRGE